MNQRCKLEMGSGKNTSSTMIIINYYAKSKAFLYTTTVNKITLQWIVLTLLQCGYLSYFPHDGSQHKVPSSQLLHITFNNIMSNMLILMKIFTCTTCPMIVFDINNIKLYITHQIARVQRIRLHIVSSENCHRTSIVRANMLQFWHNFMSGENIQAEITVMSDVYSYSDIATLCETAPDKLRLT